MLNDKDVFDTIMTLSNEVAYGDLKIKIKDVPSVEFLSSEEEVKARIKNNKYAWEIYRAWLKVYEPDKNYIKKHKELLTVLLDEPITEENTTSVRSILSRIGNIPIWSKPNLEKFNKLIYKSNMEWFSWELVHVQEEISNRYPWNICLTNWCVNIKDRLDVTKDEINEVQQKAWSFKAKCLIMATILTSNKIKSLFQVNELKDIATSISPEIVKLGEDLIDDPDKQLDMIASHFLFKSKTIEQTVEDFNNNKIGKDLLTNIEFTFDW